MSETQVIKLITTNSQICKLRTTVDISYVITCCSTGTHIITEEYWGSTLAISVLGIDRGGIEFAMASAVQEILHWHRRSSTGMALEYRVVSGV